MCVQGWVCVVQYSECVLYTMLPAPFEWHTQLYLCICVQPLPSQGQQPPQPPQQSSAQILESLVRQEEDPRLAKLVNIQEKRSSTKLRAEANVRPKWWE